MEATHKPALLRSNGAPADAEARIALVERLLDASTTDECADRALEWLAAHAGQARGLYMGYNSREQNLVGVAGRGLALDDVGNVVVDASDAENPFSWMIGATQIVELDSDDERAWLPDVIRGAARVVAAPVGVAPESPAIGVLLLEPADPDALDSARLEWAVTMLGMRLSHLWQAELPIRERRMRREREWLYGLIDAVTDPILLTDSTGRILVANRGAEDLLMPGDDASEGRRHAVALNNMMFSAALAPSGPGDATGRRELLLVDPEDGTDLMLELLSTPLQIRAGEVGTVAILRNITDLHRAFEELEANYHKLRAAEADEREKRDRLDLILNSVGDPILVTNAEGEVVLMNPPAAELLTVGEGAGAEVEKRVQANDVVLSSFLSDVYTGGAVPRRQQIKLSDPASGRSLPIEAIGTVYNETSGDTGVVTILHDRSEAVEKARLYEQVSRHSADLEERVREATAELAAQNELLRRQALQLEQASAMKSQFLANVSHELRTPLNAMLGYTAILLENVYGELNEVQREKLGRVAANARHLKTIIDEVLDITKIEAGKIALKPGEFDISRLIDEVLAELGGLIDESGLEVTAELEGEVPRLRSDAAKVKQILINLLSNALKFTNEGSVSIRARHDGAEGTILIDVTDTGIGIRPEDQETIFDAFGQSGGGPPGSGTGLGLSICRRLADVLGGDIELDSEPGEGSRFTLTIPRCLPEKR